MSKRENPAGDANPPCAAPGHPFDNAGPPYTVRRGLMNLFDRLASRATRWAGSPLAFMLAFVLVLIWAITGPIFAFSETWQLVINTGTTIVTFLMVFLIQQSQNKDCQAVHLKLDELLHAMKGARDELIDIESLAPEDLDRLGQQFKRNGQQPTP